MNVSLEVVEEGADYFSKITDAAQDSFDFSSIPLYLMDVIMEKFTFKQFAAFEGTCQLAQDLSFRNQRLQFPVETKKICVLSNCVWFNDRNDSGKLSIEECSRMKFPPVKVISGDFSLPKKTCNFLLKLEITTFKCFFPEFQDLHVKEFFKNANIRFLKMTTIHINRNVEKFYYDTSNIDQVEVDNCQHLSADAGNSIKARQRVYLSNAHVLASNIIQYVEKVKNGEEKVIDMSFHNARMYIADPLEIFLYLIDNFTYEGNMRWILKDNEEKTIMVVETIELGLRISKC